nr:DUF551 domain-containing protein [Oscillospiraceae bacterium]
MSNKELIKALRDDNACLSIKTAHEAADAIEELQAGEKKFLRNISALEMENENLKRERRWIPVTERLPEILHTVIVSGRMKYKWETDFFRFVDVATYSEGEFFETFNDWYEGQDEFEITHWMPLPEPPKEEPDA